MLKHNDIISKLSDIQKIRILTNIGNISGKDLKILGIPSVKPGAVKDYYRATLPHAEELVRSFDAGLWKRVAAERIGAMVADGVNFVKVNGAKPRFSPYRKELSEDPYLASEMARASATAAAERGVMAGFSGYYLTELDVEWMDKTPSERVIREYAVRPYLDAVKKSGVGSVISSTRMPGDAYEHVNDAMCRAIEGELAGDKATLTKISRG